LVLGIPSRRSPIAGILGNDDSAIEFTAHTARGRPPGKSHVVDDLVHSLDEAAALVTTYSLARGGAERL